jgi:hypothetical protein
MIPNKERINGNGVNKNPNDMSNDTSIGFIPIWATRRFDERNRLKFPDKIVRLFGPEIRIMHVERVNHSEFNVRVGVKK